MPKKTRKQRKLKGGKLVQQGSQGCIYYPALRCDDAPGRNPNVISKLTYLQNGIHEMGFHTLLAPIDPTQKYFIYPLRMCHVRKEDLDPVENSLKECKVTPRWFKEDLSDAISLEYPLGGVDLVDLRPTFEEYIPFLSAFENLLEGLVLLHRNNITHLDIKPENIVALKREDGSFHLRFIDFGFMTLTVGYALRNPPLPLQILPYWPIEMSFIDSRFKETYLNEKMLEKYKKGLREEILPALPEPSLLNIISLKDMKDLYQISQGYVQEGNVDKILKASDIYSIGIVLSKIFFSLTGHRQVNEKIVFQTQRKPHPSDPFWIWHKTIAADIFYPLYELVWDMTLFDFENRPTAEEVLMRYQRIIPEIQRYFTPELLHQYLFQ